MAFQSFVPTGLVRRLLNWRQGDEEETWRNKALDTLIKKLKRQPGEQYATLQMIMNRKSEDTPCITIPRSQDGRLQVSHRKMLPQVMYCRIFRWPDLQSHHELRSVPTCPYPAQRREGNRICVNPYHYTRVDHPVYPPVVTPRSNEFADASPPPQSPLSPGFNYSSQQQSPNYFGSQPSSVQMAPIPQPAHHQAYQSPQHQQENQNDALGYLGAPQLVPMQQSIHGSQQQMPVNFYPNQSPLSDSSWNGAAGSVGPHGDSALMNMAESPRGIQQFDSQSSPPPGYSGRSQQMAAMPMTVDDCQNNSAIDESQEHWCRITYAELNQKIGEPFKGSSPEVIVDGFTDPSVHNRRFSLGVLSNINRNSTIEMTRRAIRRGVCLENCNEAQIFVKNLSESSIFFHSKNCNVENQLNQHAVVKIEPQGRHKIFDQKVFENLVQEAIRSQDGKTYERLFSLTEHCIIKMSFVKGWGSIYQRQDVTSTPCWIEIHLLKPYALIDQYLRQVRPPSSQITSTS